MNNPTTTATSHPPPSHLPPNRALVAQFQCLGQEPILLVQCSIVCPHYFNHTFSHLKSVSPIKLQALPVVCSQSQASTAGLLVGNLKPPPLIVQAQFPCPHRSTQLSHTTTTS